MRTTACLFLALLGSCATRYDRTVHATWVTRTTQSPLAMTVTPSNHIYVRGTVNEVETEMLVDSGAGITVLDRAFADELDLRRFGTVVASGVGGTETAAYVRIPRIRVGDLMLSNVLAVTLDLSEIALRIDRPIPVILGREVFQSAVVEVDYPRSRLTLHRRSAFRYEGEGNTVRLRPNGSALRSVRCQIEDEPPAWFQLDTGSGKTVSVFEEYTAQRGLLDDRTPRSKRISGGVGGFDQESIASLRTFEFAGYTLRDMPASFPTPKTGAFTSRRLAGNLGAGVLRRFRLFVDFRRNRMHVEPGPDVAASFDRDRLGLITLPREGRLEVVLAAPGSPAAKAGIREGTTLVRVDGATGTPAELRRRLRDAARQPDGAVVELRDDAGRDYRLRLATHYLP